MEAIKIGVNKQMDGYTFSMAPSMRALIRSWFPNAHPANNIFVAYDTQSDFEDYYGQLELTFIQLYWALKIKRISIKKWTKFYLLRLKQAMFYIRIRCEDRI